MKIFKLKYIYKIYIHVFLILLIYSCKTTNSPLSSTDGFEKIFDGKTLNDWVGDPTYWSVGNGSLVGEVTPSTLLERNSFIIWRGGSTKNFEFKAEYRISEDGNSGINYRSEEIKDIPYALVGYQCDIDGKNRYTGMNYEERRRTTLANPGQVVLLENIQGSTNSIESNIKSNQWLPAKVISNATELDSYKAQIKPNEWNSVHIVVNGNRMQHFVNGFLMSDVTDEDKVNGRFEGLLGVQVHVGPPMKIEYKNMMIKHLK